MRVRQLLRQKEFNRAIIDKTDFVAMLDTDSVFRLVRLARRVKKKLLYDYRVLG